MSTPGAPERRHRSRLAIWLGAIAAVIGLLLAAAGAAVLIVGGSDGRLTTDRSRLATPTSALVSQTASIDDTAGAADALGDVRIRVSAEAAGGRPLFVGIGRSRDVDRYLAGVPADEITDFEVDPLRVERSRRAGTRTPAPPARQTFWVARATGRTADLEWKLRDGDFRAVVLNADGSRGVDTRAKFGVEVPALPWIGLGLLVAGLVLLAGGVVAIVVGSRRVPA
ncbi:MAG TPA: hypothetical protein VN751_08165 [Solirubrobacteraceae bacterium]|nr:hypothetical protein [Solirubrobacteraceae bacterium]